MDVVNQRIQPGQAEEQEGKAQAHRAPSSCVDQNVQHYELKYIKLWNLNPAALNIIPLQQFDAYICPNSSKCNQSCPELAPKPHSLKKHLNSCPYFQYFFVVVHSILLIKISIWLLTSQGKKFRSSCELLIKIFDGENLYFHLQSSSHCFSFLCHDTFLTHYWCGLNVYCCESGNML